MHGPQSRFDGYLWVQIVIMWLQTHTPGPSLAHSGPICFSPEAASQDTVGWKSPLHTFFLTLSDAWWGHHLGLCADDCALRFWQQLPGLSRAIGWNSCPMYTSPPGLCASQPTCLHGTVLSTRGVSMPSHHTRLCTSNVQCGDSLPVSALGMHSLCRYTYVLRDETYVNSGCPSSHPE